MSLNKVMLIGFVGQDPEVRYVGAAGNQNSKVAQFRLATTEKYRDRDGNIKENTEWHSIVAWRGLADLAEKYIAKGTQLYIEGKLRTRSWEDQSGDKRYVTEVLVNSIQFLEKKERSEVAQDMRGSQQMTSQSMSSAGAPQDDDLPF